MRHLPTQRPGTLETRGGCKVYRGDLGAHEMLTLTISRHRRRHYTDPVLLDIKVRGYFDIYCGYGGEHREPISVDDCDTTAGNGCVAAIWTRSDDEAASTLLGRMVEDAIDDWSDPCADFDREAEEATSYDYRNAEEDDRSAAKTN